MVKQNVASNLLQPTNEAHITPRPGPTFPAAEKKSTSASEQHSRQHYYAAARRRASLTDDGEDFPDRGGAQHSFGDETVGQEAGRNRRDPLREERQRRQETVLRKNRRALKITQQLVNESRE